MSLPPSRRKSAGTGDIAATSVTKGRVSGIWIIMGSVPSVNAVSRSTCRCFSVMSVTPTAPKTTPPPVQAANPAPSPATTTSISPTSPKPPSASTASSHPSRSSNHPHPSPHASIDGHSPWRVRLRSPANRSGYWKSRYILSPTYTIHLLLRNKRHLTIGLRRKKREQSTTTGRNSSAATTATRSTKLRSEMSWT